MVTKIITPEQLLGLPTPKLSWHHGTCDVCNARHILILHFGYDQKPPQFGYRMCKNCISKYLLYIIYGKEQYEHCHIDDQYFDDVIPDDMREM